jgi:5'-3' exonuclease
MIPPSLYGDPRGLVIVDWSMLVRAAYRDDGVSDVASLVLGKIWRLLFDGETPASMVIAVDPERVDPETGQAVRRRTWRDLATAHLPEKQQYKSGRIPKPPELVRIEQRMFRVIAALKIPFLVHSNPAAEQDFDADDAMGTACKIAREEGRRVAILTRDKDMFQCVTDEEPSVVRWWPFLTQAERDNGTPEQHDEKAVMRKLSVMPNQVCDYLSMRGDKSDNIDGVNGIGESGAAELLFTYGTLDAALEDICARAKAIEDRGKINELESDCPECGAVVNQQCFGRSNGHMPLKRNHKVRRQSIESMLDPIVPLTRAEQLLYEQRDSAIASRVLVRLLDYAPIRWEPQKQMIGGFDIPRARVLLQDFGFTRMHESLAQFPKHLFTIPEPIDDTKY